MYPCKSAAQGTLSFFKDGAKKLPQWVTITFLVLGILMHLIGLFGCLGTYAIMPTAFATTGGSSALMVIGLAMAILSLFLLYYNQQNTHYPLPNRKPQSTQDKIRSAKKEKPPSAHNLMVVNFLQKKGVKVGNEPILLPEGLFDSKESQNLSLLIVALANQKIVESKENKLHKQRRIHFSAAEIQDWNTSIVEEVLSKLEEADIIIHARYRADEGFWFYG